MIVSKFNFQFIKRTMSARNSLNLSTFNYLHQKGTEVMFTSTCIHLPLSFSSATDYSA